MLATVHSSSEVWCCNVNKLVKVKNFNWLGRPQYIKIFENECDIRNQRIKKQQDRSVEKNCDIKCKTGHPSEHVLEEDQGQ